MTDERDEFERERADRLDAALDRARATAQHLEDDPEIEELLAIAQELERELPASHPDPVFRQRLAEQLGIEPGASHAGAAPVDLDATRQRRRPRFDWRFGAVAAVAALLLLGLIVNWDALTEDPGTERPGDTGIAALQEQTESAEEGAAEETPTFAERVVFPRLDRDHVIEAPFGTGTVAAFDATTEASATVVPAQLQLATELPTLPAMAESWELSGPEDPETFLETVGARLGLDAEIVEVQGTAGRQYHLVDDQGIPVVQWDHEAAFFNYARNPEMQTPPPERAESDPEETARAWLEEAGFDLVSIEYESSVVRDQTLSVVEFVPVEVPQGELQPGLGMTVGVTEDGAIQFAHGYWLSLEASGEVPLRTAEAAWDAVLAGDGYWPAISPAPGPDTTVTFDTVRNGWLLTHADDGSYLVQPVVVFSGQRQPDIGFPETEVYVSAVSELPVGAE